MVGDINFFLYPWDGHEPEGDEKGKAGDMEETRYCFGEIDVMIADKGHRGQGHGFAAVTALMLYIHRNLAHILTEYGGAPPSPSPTASLSCPPRLKNLTAKIKETNTMSIALFRRVGFKQRGKVNWFGEVVMVLDDFARIMADRSLDWVQEAEKTYREAAYLQPETGDVRV
jgi:RimJ/RimL family protein N-acetyltransferase